MRIEDMSIDQLLELNQYICRRIDEVSPLRRGMNAYFGDAQEWRRNYCVAPLHSTHLALMNLRVAQKRLLTSGPVLLYLKA